MASVFNKIGDIKNDVKRNSFDWSHDNNFTTDLGRITPVFTELVPPNSSVRIKPEFGLRFMPMMFPIQTKMKAYLSFFKVPLRTLWKDYMDFISADNTEEYQPPFMDFTSSDYEEGGSLYPSGLGDYLGIPIPAKPKQSPTPVSPVSFKLAPNSVLPDFPYYYARTSNHAASKVVVESATILTDPSTPPVPFYPRAFFFYRPSLVLASGSPTPVAGNTYRVSFLLTIPLNYGVGSSNAVFDFLKKAGTVQLYDFGVGQNYPDSIPLATLEENNRGTLTPFTEDSFSLGVSPTGVPYIQFRLYSTFTGDEYLSNSSNFKLTFCASIPAFSGLFIFEKSTTLNGYYLKKLGNPPTMTSPITSDVVAPDASFYSPYYGTGNGILNNTIRISAYPFRAYEAIYNAYIRNTRNNPFVLNGRKTYNKWITTDAGGVDTLTPRSLRYANWMSDAYTTALQSPQQGTAPLVGLTTYETQSINEVGHAVTTVNTAIIDEDGNAYKVDFESNGEALKGVNYTPLKSGEMVNAQSLVSPVTSGISINDFRNVNAYQRYLELNQFRGFSYKEIIEGRFDVNVRYDALNMPEYLGGITRDVIVNPITQTVETSSDGSYQGALGSQAGFATCFGNSDGSISVFCDEESIVMGVMYIVPMPVYDSVLPKWFSYRDRLDSFNPEFDHIGYQPIPISELAPTQAIEQGISLNTVFGYQRPWYEYVQKLDRAHGLFLSSLRNFIMYRSFKTPPELGSDFTTMKPGDVNNVFSVTEVSDKILGQIHFNCTAQLPISRVVVPKLE